MNFAFAPKAYDQAKTKFNSLRKERNNTSTSSSISHHCFGLVIYVISYMLNNGLNWRYMEETALTYSQIPSVGIVWQAYE